MDIRIQHRTSYAYEALASHSIQLLRLTPHEHDGQRVGRWTITGNGRRDLPEIEDAFGNIVHSLSMSEAHDAVEIAVSGVVHTMDTNGVVKGLPEPMPLAVYLRTTDLTEPDDTLRDLASGLASTATRDPLDTAHRLMEAVRGAIDYRTGTTDAATTAAEALGAGKGVCQDHAHVMIACARILNIPARYVSGYLAGDGGEVHEASHAWAELRIERLGWVGFDAANKICPTERHVRIGHGLDYHGAAPVNGVRRGFGADHLSVSVEISPIIQQDQALDQAVEQTGAGDPRIDGGTERRQ